MSPAKSISQNEDITPTTLDREDLGLQQDVPEEVTIEAEIDDNPNQALPADILTLLGDAPKESPMGKDIHTDIATRMKVVLCEGLKKEQKDKLIEEYPIPGNCQFFKAPILNPEVKAAVSEILHKKDASLAARQEQIGIVLSALTTTMDIIISKKFDTTLVLKHVSNACRLLCDSHYMDAKIRRNFLISSLNNKLKDTLKESKPEKYLFGDALHEHIKATKAINRSSLDLKQYNAKPRPVKQNKASGSSAHLNWKNPQPNHQMHNAYRKMTTPAHRTAGSSASQRNKMPHKPVPAPASRTSAPYRNLKRS